MNENLSVEYGWCIAALAIAGIVITIAVATLRAHKGDSDEPTSNPSRPDPRGKPRRNQHRGRGNDRARGIDNLPYPVAEPDAGVPVVDGAAVLRDVVRPAGGPDDQQSVTGSDGFPVRYYRTAAELDADLAANTYPNAGHDADHDALTNAEPYRNAASDRVRDGRQDGEGDDLGVADERRG